VSPAPRGGAALDARIVITLDIGGSGVKASAYDARRSVNVASVIARYPADPDAEPGTFSPDMWWSSAVQGCRALADRIGAAGGEYLGITVSAIRIPFVLIDRDREVVLPSLLNRDRRAEGQVHALIRDLGEQPLYETTGHWAAPEFGLPKLLWIRQTYPDAWRAVGTILQLHDWFVYKLSGVLVSEPSSAAMSQMMDIKAGGWAGDMLAALDVPVSMLPPMRPAGASAGTLRPEVAARTGLPSGLPVHVGGGDTHLSALAAGALTEPIPVVVAGTTGPAQLALPRGDGSGGFAGYHPLLVSEQPLTRNWVLESNAGPTGEIVDRLADFLAATGEELRAALVAQGFDLRPDPAQEADLLVLTGNPCFGPDGWKVWPPPAVIGLRPSHHGADVRQAALRGTCLAFAAIVAQLRERSASDPEAIVAAGGMSASQAWNAMLADAAGRPVRVRPPDRLAGLAGAALVAGPNVLAALDQMEATVYLPSRPEPALGRYVEQFRAAQRRAGTGGAGSRAGAH
jgi:xylulokinase